MTRITMNEQKKKTHKVFIQGPISPAFIADSIAKHSSKTGIGAHTIFLGQVRKDAVNGQTVQAILYSAYEEMAEKEFHTIREAAFEKYPLTCMHIYHSLGQVNAGEISLFVFVSSVHREAVFTACSEIVEQIKMQVPIWGKEMLEDGSFIWKVNTIRKADKE
jgi:molybdopterin synthase catalytic subunit